MNKMSISRKQGNFPETKTTKLSMLMRTREGATTFLFSPHVASQTRVKTCKRWQAAHLHRRETFENLFHIALLRRTLSGILQFKCEPWYSFDIADQDTARYSLCSARENCVSWAEPFKCQQQTIYSVRAYSCWICSPFMRYVYSKIQEFFIAAVILGYLLLISP